MSDLAPRWEIDPTGFLEMVQGLQQISGKSFEHILIDQAGAVLKNCIAHTPAAKGGAIAKRVSRHNNYIEFPSGEVIAVWKKAGYVQMFLDNSTYQPAKGTKAPLVVNGKTWHQMDGGKSGRNERRWSDERWSKFQALLSQAEKMKQDFEKALGARGLAKHSWLQAGLDLGIESSRIGAASYVQTARPSNGQQYKNGFAKTLLEAGAIYIEISNDQPILVEKLDGARILQASVDARVRAFQIETEKGVFDDIAARAKRYPGIFTSN